MRFIDREDGRVELVSFYHFSKLNTATASFWISSSCSAASLRTESSFHRPTRSWSTTILSPNCKTNWISSFWVLRAIIQEVGRQRYRHVTKSLVDQNSSWRNTGTRITLWDSLNLRIILIFVTIEIVQSKHSYPRNSDNRIKNSLSHRIETNKINK